MENFEVLFLGWVVIGPQSTREGERKRERE